LEVAHYNVEMKDLEHVITLYQGDLFDALPTFFEGDLSLEDDDVSDKILSNSSGHKMHMFQQQYDLIITNPPYVTKADMLNLPSEYQHEPKLALEAGKDGLAIVSKILLNAQKYLKDGGGMLCEVGQCRAALEKKYGKIFGPHSKKVHWIKTANSIDEVFYIKKEHLNPANFA
jgi:ribosomal protein L3 glutamine methyltransferase